MTPHSKSQVSAAQNDYRLIRLGGVVDLPYLSCSPFRSDDLTHLPHVDCLAVDWGLQMGLYEEASTGGKKA